MLIYHHRYFFRALPGRIQIAISFVSKGMIAYATTCIVSILFIFCVYGCSTDTEKVADAPSKPTDAQMLAPETNPIASVNGRQVDIDRFNKQYKNRLKKLQNRLPGTDIQPTMALSIKKTVAQLLINEQLIEQAAQDRKLSITNGDIDTAWKALELSMAGRLDFQHYVENFPSGKTGIRRRLRLQLLKDQLAGIDLEKKISEDQVRTYYERHIQTFNIPVHFVVRDMIFLVKQGPESEEDVVQKAKAETFAAQAQQPNIQFAALARKHSEGGIAASGGWLKRATQDNTESVLWDTLSTMKPNQISGVIRAADGYHILKLIRKNDAVVKPFEEVKQSIGATIAKRRRTMKIARLMEDLRKQASIDNYLDARYETAKGISSSPSE